jgi:hypothetical protein
MRTAPIVLLCFGFIFGLVAARITDVKILGEHGAKTQMDDAAKPQQAKQGEPAVQSEPRREQETEHPDAALFGPPDRAFSAAFAAERDETDEAFRYLFRHNGTSEEHERKRQTLFNKICQDPVRKGRMLERIITEFKADRGYVVKEIMTIPDLSELGGQDYVPLLRDRFTEYERESRCVGPGHERLPLMQAIAHFLPERERIRFLIATESDETEGPVVRYHATLLLCASGDELAIRHVLKSYREAQEKYPRTKIVTLEDQQRYASRTHKPDKEPWDQDRDMMADFKEQGLLLDPARADTDGDGLLDGNDRNPLCAPTASDADTADIARFLVYLHTRYGDNVRGPYSDKVWIVSATNVREGTVLPSMSYGVEFTGIDGVILHLDQNQRGEYMRLHGYGTPQIFLNEHPEPDGDERRFAFTEYVGPLHAVWYEIRMRCFDGVWLPVKRTVVMIS